MGKATTIPMENMLPNRLKFPLLVCLLIFHCLDTAQVATANDSVKIDADQTNQIIKRGTNEATITSPQVAHLVDDTVYPDEANGFYGLKSWYDKKVPPSHKIVRGWMRPTFVTYIDSIKQSMGLEIYYISMWQEDDRVEWTMQEEMKQGKAYPVSGHFLE